MKIQKTIVYVAIALCGYSTSSFAQEAAPAATTTTEEEKPFTLSGSVDAYYHTSFGSKTKAPNTSFANLNGFGLGMVNLISAYDGEKVGFKADVVFGPRGFDAVFANGYTNQRIVNQLYAYYKLGKKVTLNLGQFNTFFGYEVISPTGNFHYSTSYMFSWGPFNHTGLRADFDLGSGWVGKLAIMNPTDLVEFNPVNTYTLGGQIGYASDGGSIYFNVLYGDQDGKMDKNDPDLNADDTSQGSTLALDITTGWNLSEKFYLGLNTTYRTKAKGETFTGTTVIDTDEDSNGFYGVALYPKLTLSENFALGLRGEYFKVSKDYFSTVGGASPIGLDAKGNGSVTAITLSGNYKTGGLTIIPELRLDNTSEDTFQDGDYKPTKQLFTANLAAVYKF